jgi:hypothetical protein
MGNLPCLVIPAPRERREIRNGTKLSPVTQRPKRCRQVSPHPPVRLTAAASMPDSAREPFGELDTIRRDAGRRGKDRPEDEALRGCWPPPVGPLRLFAAVPPGTPGLDILASEEEPVSRPSRSRANSAWASRPGSRSPDIPGLLPIRKLATELSSFARRGRRAAADPLPGESGVEGTTMILFESRAGALPLPAGSRAPLGPVCRGCRP